MGREAKAVKPRKCKKCEKEFELDAVGIKDHAEACKGK